MNNMEQIIRRMRLAGSHTQISSGETRRLFLYLLQEIEKMKEKTEKLENEISLCRSKTCTESGDPVSPSGVESRGRGRPKSEPKSSSSSGSKGTNT